MAADYEYEFDERGNWTKGSVWTWTQESRDRKLYWKQREAHLFTNRELHHSTRSDSADTERDDAGDVRLAIEDDRRSKSSSGSCVIPSYSITRRDLAFAGTVNDTNSSRPRVSNP
jgi:hypothetical protein